MIRAMCLALTLAACATTEAPSTAAGHQPAEEAAILAVMDACIHEISAHDLAAMDASKRLKAWPIASAPAKTAAGMS